MGKLLKTTSLLTLIILLITGCKQKKDDNVFVRMVVYEPADETLYMQGDTLTIAFGASASHLPMLVEISVKHSPSGKEILQYSKYAESSPSSDSLSLIFDSLAHPSGTYRLTAKVSSGPSINISERTLSFDARLPKDIGAAYAVLSSRLQQTYLQFYSPDDTLLKEDPLYHQTDYLEWIDGDLLLAGERISVANRAGAIIKTIQPISPVKQLRIDGRKFAYTTEQDGGTIHFCDKSLEEQWVSKCKFGSPQALLTTSTGVVTLEDFGGTTYLCYYDLSTGAFHGFVNLYAGATGRALYGLNDNAYVYYVFEKSDAFGIGRCYSPSLTTADMFALGLNELNWRCSPLALQNGYVAFITGSKVQIRTTISDGVYGTRDMSSKIRWVDIHSNEDAMTVVTEEHLIRTNKMLYETDRVAIRGALKAVYFR